MPPLSGEEIQRRLVDFARKWTLYQGSERAEAQTFLNELFACYGTDRRDADARFEEPQEGRFVDLIGRSNSAARSRTSCSEASSTCAAVTGPWR